MNRATKRQICHSDEKTKTIAIVTGNGRYDRAFLFCVEFMSVNWSATQKTRV